MTQIYCHLTHEMYVAVRMFLYNKKVNKKLENMELGLRYTVNKKQDDTRLKS